MFKTSWVAELRKDEFPMLMSIDSLSILTNETGPGAKFRLNMEKILALGIFLSLNRNPHWLEASALTSQQESAFRWV